MLLGGMDVAKEAGIVIAGGHTVKDVSPSTGLPVAGIVRPDRIITNAAAAAGDDLVLTKPLGSGIITTAAKAGVTDDATLAGAVSTMRRLNRAASGSDGGGERQGCHRHHRLRARGPSAWHATGGRYRREDPLLRHPPPARYAGSPPNAASSPAERAITSMRSIRRSPGTPPSPMRRSSSSAMRRRQRPAHRRTVRVDTRANGRARPAGVAGANIGRVVPGKRPAMR